LSSVASATDLDLRLTRGYAPTVNALRMKDEEWIGLVKTISPLVRPPIA